QLRPPVERGDWRTQLLELGSRERTRDRGGRGRSVVVRVVADVTRTSNRQGRQRQGQGTECKMGSLLHDRRIKAAGVPASLRPSSRCCALSRNRVTCYAV